MDCTTHGILQARILERVAVPFSRESSQPRDWNQVSQIAGGFFTSRATRAREPSNSCPVGFDHVCGPVPVTVVWKFPVFSYLAGIFIKAISVLFYHYVSSMSEGEGNWLLVFGFIECEWPHPAMIEMTEYHPEFLDFELNTVTRWHFGFKEHVDEWTVARLAICPWCLLSHSFKF